MKQAEATERTPSAIKTKAPATKIDHVVAVIVTCHNSADISLFDDRVGKIWSASDVHRHREF
jgi:hypothetical protein